MSSDPQFDSQSSQNNQFQSQSQEPRSQRKSLNKQSSQSSHQSNNSKNQSSFDQTQLTQIKKLEIQIITSLATRQKHTPYQKEIMQDILQKLQAFKQASKNKTGQDLITLKIQQLVLTKLLVLTYGKSDFRLAACHYHLGLAYFDNQCYQQSIQHISSALQKTQKLLIIYQNPQTPKISKYHNLMQNSLGKCLIQKGNIQDAIEILRNAIEYQTKNKTFISDSNLNTQAMILLSQCYYKLKQYSEATETINIVIKGVQDKQGGNRQQLAFALNQKAKIEAACQNYQQAISCQDSAINILIQINYSKPQEVAEMYSNLSRYYQLIDNIQNAIKCMQKVKKLNQQIFGENDKNIINSKRKIATLNLKAQNLKQGLQELSQVLQLEQTIFGQGSNRCAKTLKLLGYICIKLESNQAKIYLRKSMNIFNSHGNKKQVLQIKNKLKLLEQGQTGTSLLQLKVITEQDAA